MRKDRVKRWKDRVKRWKDRVKRKALLVKEIMQAMDYREGSHWSPGPMVFSGVVRRLGGAYEKDSIEDLLENADLSELEDAHSFLDERGFILPAQERSVQIRAEIKFCPHCGERL